MIHNGTELLRLFLLTEQPANRVHYALGILPAGYL